MLSYDKERKTISVERKNFHCVRIVNKDVGGTMTPQAHNEAVGSRKLEFDLSPDGNKAILKTEYGEKKFNIVPSIDELDRIIVGFQRGRFVVGDLKSGLKDGKDGLIEYLGQEGPDKVDLNHDIAMGRLETILLTVAEKSNLLPKSPDILDDFHNLQKRDDFEFDKDYMYLYQNKLLLKCTVDSAQYEAYGNLGNNDTIFEASDIIIFRDGQEIKDFGETWAGISEDANDFYHCMLCGYLNHDSDFKNLLACSEIRDYMAKEQEVALTYEKRKIPKYCFDIDGNKLELQMVLKPKDEDNYSCYYALDDYNVSLTDKSGHIMTNIPEFFENSLYDDIDNNATPVFLSEGGKVAYNDIKKEISTNQPTIDILQNSSGYSR